MKTKIETKLKTAVLYLSFALVCGAILDTAIIKAILAVQFPQKQTVCEIATSTIEIIATSTKEAVKEVSKATSTVKDRIIAEAEKANFKWTDYLLKLAKCESGLRENATNSSGNNPAHSTDRGVFQISDYWHKEVPDSVAYNVEEATKWTMWMIESGHQSAWACDRLIKNNPAKYAVN